jgi:hypothetical protein
MFCLLVYIVPEKTGTLVGRLCWNFGPLTQPKLNKSKGKLKPLRLPGRSRLAIPEAPRYLSLSHPTLPPGRRCRRWQRPFRRRRRTSEARPAVLWSREAWRRAGLVVCGEGIEAKGSCGRGMRSSAAACSRRVRSSAALCGAQVRSVGRARSGPSGPWLPCDATPGSGMRQFPGSVLARRLLLFLFSNPTLSSSPQSAGGVGATGSA